MDHRLCFVSAALCLIGVLCAGCAQAPAESQISAAATAATEPIGSTEAAETSASAAAYRRDGQFIIYSENGVTASETGVDVSSYSGEIDWQRVRDAGITFAMVRLGGRGYGDEGALYSDDNAVENIRNAQAAGIRTGGYFFSQATTEQEAREEAAFCRELLGDLNLDCPLAYDWEYIKDDDARTDGLTSDETTACARAFCDEVRSYGWTPMLYAGDDEFTAKYDLNKLGDVEIWHCEYADEPHAPYPIGMWQYSKTAEIDGIEGSADLDLRYTKP